MRVLSIVTLMSPDGSYGGPVRVALNQAAALRERGHDVVVAGGHRGFSTVPTMVAGVPVSLFPVRSVLPGTGFAGLASPELHRWLAANAPTVDVVHVHAARDLITLRAANWLRKSGTPYVLQTHGMIDPSRNPLAVPLDAAVTRPVLRAARQIFYLTEQERADLTSVGGPHLRLRELSNGVPTPPFTPPESEPAGDGTRPAEHRPEVLFLARLAPRKRPRSFVAAARLLAAAHTSVSFRLVGPDEGEGAGVLRDIAEARGLDIRWEGPLPPESTTQRMAAADVYVLPSVDEPYPMSVLEAMALGRPVVITDTCGLAPLVESAQCGIVVDSSVAALADAIGRLLHNPQLARQMGETGARVAKDRLSMESIAVMLEDYYQR